MGYLKFNSEKTYLLYRITETEHAIQTGMTGPDFDVDFKGGGGGDRG